MTTPREILISLKGTHAQNPALDFGVNLAKLTRWPVTLMGISPQEAPVSLQQALEDAASRLAADGIASRSILKRENFGKAVLGYLGSREDVLTLFSDIHQPGLPRWLRFGRFRSLYAGSQSPLIRVRTTCWPLRRLLVCSGGLAYTIPLEKLVVRLAQAAGAELTLLHIIEPITLDYSLARELSQHWEMLQQTDTPQARHLQKALDYAQQAGVKAAVRVRHGDVVKNILEELDEGGYDLVGLGSAYSSHALRRHFSPDVTALVAASVDCPVLTMRGAADSSYG